MKLKLPFCRFEALVNDCCLLLVFDISFSLGNCWPWKYDEGNPRLDFRVTFSLRLNYIVIKINRNNHFETFSYFLLSISAPSANVVNNIFVASNANTLFYSDLVSMSMNLCGVRYVVVSGYDFIIEYAFGLQK